ncbi:MAG TPA: 4-(cytidine 5'-diphospho)-2-C-methyl-D-erythritol kinase [Ignavibacteriaceae bacterium]|nr:4-(cytidine 5'-diphospho)-2-C-methyl-D-erythritol kinase [Ignavibacteriaceae bacterium]
MDQIKVKSPVKINIGLNIIRKREDGFHDLETIFYPLNLNDEITFTKSDSFLFTSNDELLNKEPTNLIIKAKEELEGVSGKTLNVKIELKKNIPIGAGLGGGSSNAAITLKTLNSFLEPSLTAGRPELLSVVALKLGSDVPYFLNPVPAFAESRGEKIIPINLKIDKTILIVNPGLHISTKWAFGLIKPHKQKVSLKSLINYKEISIDDLKQIAVNDFEEVVFPAYPEIKYIKEVMMNCGAIISMMTGTGSTVFGIFKNKKAAEEAALKFPDQYFKFVNS